MDLELRHLKIVSAVADAGSVSKAAVSLGLAQPALTAQLKRIERVLGGALFHRDHTGARPTALGELVLTRAKVLLPAARQLQEEATRFVNSSGGERRLRVGATGSPLFGGLVDRLARAHPTATVTTYTSWSAEKIADMVTHGRLDFALVGVCGESRPPSADTLAWRTIAVDAVCALVAQDHPLAGEAEVGLGALRRESWAIAPGEGCFTECFFAACAKAGFTPRTVYEADVATCVHLAQVGRAVALCQATFRLTPGLTPLPIAGAPLRWRQLIGWHPDSPAARTAPAIAMHAKAAHTEAVQRSRTYLNWLSKNPEFGLLLN
ncbi:LysR family transcriptional regulator [Thermostaphylospora chromogena]|uniref:DNA-binding transcriptional regulator, LysR family n=1 Tax=Thermostaphylospora chromogena TaxID=35622 RepID=A0A1H1FYH4_9ACTN|nr:LysR family transcriptional regulator [Thermostaphylospora chromogena]SDR05971.1 DNA-binding transcriptional regulator, LysR family [Thermostaphylospora chromogena]